MPNNRKEETQKRITGNQIGSLVIDKNTTYQTLRVELNKIINNNLDYSLYDVIEAKMLLDHFPEGTEYPNTTVISSDKVSIFYNSKFQEARANICQSMNELGFDICNNKLLKEYRKDASVVEEILKQKEAEARFKKELKKPGITSTRSTKQFHKATSEIISEIIDKGKIQYFRRANRCLIEGDYNQYVKLIEFCIQTFPQDKQDFARAIFILPIQEILAKKNKKLDLTREQQNKLSQLGKKYQSVLGLYQIRRKTDIKSLENRVKKVFQDFEDAYQRAYKNRALDLTYESYADKASSNQVFAESSFNNLINFVAAKFVDFKPDSLRNLKRNFKDYKKDNNLNYLANIADQIELVTEGLGNNYKLAFEFLRNPRYNVDQTCRLSYDVHLALFEIFGIDKDKFDPIEPVSGSKKSYFLTRSDIQAIKDKILNSDISQIFDVTEAAKHGENLNLKLQKQEEIEAEITGGSKDSGELKNFEADFLEKQKIPNRVANRALLSSKRKISSIVLDKDGEELLEILNRLIDIAKINPEVDVTKFLNEIVQSSPGLPYRQKVRDRTDFYKAANEFIAKIRKANDSLPDNILVQQELGSLEKQINSYPKNKLDANLSAVEQVVRTQYIEEEILKSLSDITHILHCFAPNTAKIEENLQDFLKHLGNVSDKALYDRVKNNIETAFTNLLDDADIEDTNVDTKEIHAKLTSLQNKIIHYITQPPGFYKISHLASTFSLEYSDALLEEKQQEAIALVKLNSKSLNNEIEIDDGSGKGAKVKIKLSKYFGDLNKRINSAKTKLSNSTKTQSHIDEYEKAISEIREEYAAALVFMKTQDPLTSKAPIDDFTDDELEKDSINDTIFDIIMSHNYIDFDTTFDHVRKLREKLFQAVIQDLNRNKGAKNSLQVLYDAKSEEEKKQFHKDLRSIFDSNPPFVNDDSGTKEKEKEKEKEEIRNALYERLDSDNILMLNNYFRHFAIEKFKEFDHRFKPKLIIPNDTADESYKEFFCTIFKAGFNNDFVSIIENFAENDTNNLKRLNDIIEQSFLDHDERIKYYNLIAVPLQDKANLAAFLAELKSKIKIFRSQYDNFYKNEIENLEPLKTESIAKDDICRLNIIKIYRNLYDLPINDLKQRGLYHNLHHPLKYRISDTKYDFGLVDEASTFIEDVLIDSDISQAEFSVRVGKKAYENSARKEIFFREYILSQYEILEQGFDKKTTSDVNSAIESEILRNFLKETYGIVRKDDGSLSCNRIVLKDDRGNPADQVKYLKKFRDLKNILVSDIEILDFINSSDQLPYWYRKQISEDKNKGVKDEFLFDEAGNQIRELYGRYLKKDNYLTVRKVLKAKSSEGGYLETLNNIVEGNEREIKSTIDQINQEQLLPVKLQRNILYYAVLRAMNDHISKFVIEKKFDQHEDYSQLQNDISSFNGLINDVTKYYDKLNLTSLSIQDILRHYENHKENRTTVEDLSVDGIKISFNLCELVSNSYQASEKYNNSLFDLAHPSEVAIPMIRSKEIRIKRTLNGVKDKEQGLIDNIYLKNSPKILEKDRSRSSIFSTKNYVRDADNKVGKNIAFDPIIPVKSKPGYEIELQNFKSFIKAAIALNLEPEILVISELLPENFADLKFDNIVKHKLDFIRTKIQEYYNDTSAYDGISIDRETLESVETDLKLINSQSFLNILSRTDNTNQYVIFQKCFQYAAQAIELANVVHNDINTVELYNHAKSSYSTDLLRGLEKRRDSLSRSFAKAGEEDKDIAALRPERTLNILPFTNTAKQFKAYNNAKKARLKELESQIVRSKDDIDLGRKITNLNTKTEIHSDMAGILHAVDNIDSRSSKAYQKAINNELGKVSKKVKKALDNIESFAKKLDNSSIFFTTSINKGHELLCLAIIDNLIYLDSGNAVDETIFNSRVINRLQTKLNVSGDKIVQEMKDFIQSVKDVYAIARADERLGVHFFEILQVMAGEKDIAFSGTTEKDRIKLRVEDAVSRIKEFRGDLDRSLGELPSIIETAKYDAKAKDFVRQTYSPSSTPMSRTYALNQGLLQNNPDALLSLCQPFVAREDSPTLVYNASAHLEMNIKYLDGLILQTLNQSYLEFLKKHQYNGSSNQCLIEIPLVEYVQLKQQEENYVKQKLDDSDGNRKDELALRKEFKNSILSTAHPNKTNIVERYCTGCPNLEELDLIFREKLEDLHIFRRNEHGEIDNFRLIDLDSTQLGKVNFRDQTVNPIERVAIKHHEMMPVGKFFEANRAVNDIVRELANRSKFARFNNYPVSLIGQQLQQPIGVH